MRGTLTTWAIVAFCHLLFGQQRNANWLFSYGHWLQHQGGMTVSMNLPSPPYLNCTPASLSDTLGQLLLYTTEQDLRNGAHLPISGSSILNSAGVADSQDRLAMPKPGSPGRYMLFSIGSPVWNVPPRLCAVEVDMNANGGNGAVLSPVLNVLADTVTQKLTSVPHANGVDAWLIAHPFFSDSFLAFKVTAAGVDPQPVVSTAGPYMQSFLGMNTPRNAGPLVASPDGHWLAMSCFNSLPDDTLSGTVDLFTFNDTVGTVSHFAQLTDTRDAAGLAFSTSSSRLYVHQFVPNVSPLPTPSGWQVLQYDLTSANAGSINDSKVILDQEDSCGYAPEWFSMLPAPDGRILIRTNIEPATSNMLAIVQHPDSLGPACGYLRNGLILSGSSARSFPNQMRRYNEGMNLPLMVHPASMVNGLLASPNPAMDEVRLSLPGWTGPVTLTWRDALGRAVHVERPGTMDRTIVADVRSLPAGVYLLHVTGPADEHATTRVVIEH